MRIKIRAATKTTGRYGPLLVLLAASLLAPVWAGSQSASSQHESGASSQRAAFEGDGCADLAVGVPSESIGSVADAGGVNVLCGSAAGLSAEGNQSWDQDQPGIKGMADAGGGFGYALAAGDFDTDGYADFFGWALASGDLNGDGYANLAVGVPGEWMGSVANAGGVNVLSGSAAGLSGTGNQLWHQDQPGIEDMAEARDEFGRALAAGDLNGDGCADLAVGVPLESIGSVEAAGGVNLLYGSAAGLSADDNQFWHQDQPGIEGTAGAYDHFGSALVTTTPLKERYRIYLALVVRHR